MARISGMTFLTRYKKRREDPRLDDIGARMPNRRRRRKSKKQKRAERLEKQRGKTATKLFVRPDYHAYLTSKAWRIKRAKAKRFYGNKCTVCGTPDNLHVHHRHYRSLGRESMKALDLLCAGCHSNHHEGEIFGARDQLMEEFLSIMR